MRCSFGRNHCLFGNLSCHLGTYLLVGLIKTDDANKANNNNAHEDEAVEDNVAKDGVADVANKRLHPPLQHTLPHQNLANQAADPPRDAPEN